MLMPFKYPQNNYADLAFKCALISFLGLSTSFIDYSELSEDYLDKQNTLYGWIIVFILSGSVAYATHLVLLWLKRVFLPHGLDEGSKAQVLWRFRDTMLAQ